MADSKKSNILLSSLEEIKKESERETVAAEPEPKAAAASGPGASHTSALSGGLLDSLLSEVKAEAEREVQEITRNLEEKTELEKKLRAEDDEKRRLEYDRQIKEEAGRRLALIRRKEDEKKRLTREAEERESKRRAVAALKIRQEKSRKFLLRATAAVGGIIVVLVVLVATGVIPLLEDKSAQTALGEVGAKVPEGPPQFERRKKEEYDGPPIVEPDIDNVVMSIDGPAAAVLAIPEKTGAAVLTSAVIPKIDTSSEIETGKMRVRLVKALSKVRTSSSGSSGSSGSSSDGIKIDDSIFKD